MTIKSQEAFVAQRFSLPSQSSNEGTSICSFSLICYFVSFLDCVSSGSWVGAVRGGLRWTSPCAAMSTWRATYADGGMPPPERDEQERYKGLWRKRRY